MRRGPARSRRRTRGSSSSGCVRETIAEMAAQERHSVIVGPDLAGVLHVRRAGRRLDRQLACPLAAFEPCTLDIAVRNHARALLPLELVARQVVTRRIER